MVTTLFDATFSGIGGSCHIVIDYDDVALNIGTTGTGTGTPTLVQCNIIGTNKTFGPQALTPWLGAGRQVIHKNVTSTSVLPLDADRVPTKVAIQITWTS